MAKYKLANKQAQLEKQRVAQANKLRKTALQAAEVRAQQQALSQAEKQQKQAAKALDGAAPLQVPVQEHAASSQPDFRVVPLDTHLSKAQQV